MLIFDYYAKKDQDSKNYYIDIEIPNTPEDAKPYTLSLVANPQSGYSETDWSENSWSEMISEEESESTDLTSDPALDTIIYGNFAL